MTEVPSRKTTPGIVRGIVERVRHAREVRSQGFSRAAFQQLTEPVSRRLRAAVVLQAVATVILLGPYVGIWWIARALIDDGVVAWWGAAFVAVCAVVGFLLRLTAYGLSHTADVIVTRHVRRLIAGHLSRVQLGWFTGRGGRSLGALRSDVEDLHAAVAHGRLDVTAVLVGPVAALALLVVVDWRLTLVLLITPAVSYVLSTRALSGPPEVMRAVPLALGNMTDQVVRMVRDIATLRPTGRPVEDGVVDAADELRQALTRSVELQEVRGGRAGALVAPVVTLTLVLAIGTGLIALGALSVVDLLPFLLFAISVTALQRIPETTMTLRTGYAAAMRLHGLLELPTIPDPVDPAQPADDGVEFRDVRFGHDPEHTVLRGIDLVLEPGTVTALVGPSGAGKSTLAGLIGRFWDVTSGAVLVGGLDVRSHADLFRTVGFVLQDAVLVRTSLRDNIRLARSHATDAEVEQVARSARIHDRIAALPRGYDTVAGEDVRLSGGERQRVVIARLLLADPEVLVLDEATAQLDPESEAAVQDALSVLAAGRTVLVITHRLATVTGADAICVLDGGRIVQRGRHEELLAEHGGLYRRLWEASEGPAPETMEVGL